MIHHDTEAVGQSDNRSRKYDTDPFDFGLIYHEPTLIYLESLGTIEANPSDAHLDPPSRR